MRYSIITPTLLRPSLYNTCLTVNGQNCKDWEHIIVVDTTRTDSDLLESIRHPQRKVLLCEHPHKNFGNTCRHNGARIAQGEYLYYLDDDNFLCGNWVLDDLQAVTAPWAIVPIKHPDGTVRYRYPPKIGMIDTGNLLVRRDLPIWPALNDNYFAYGQGNGMGGAGVDGLYAESLMEYDCQVLYNIRPVMYYTNMSKGRA